MPNHRSQNQADAPAMTSTAATTPISQVISTRRSQTSEVNSVSSLSSEETKKKQKKTSMCSTTCTPAKSHPSQSLRSGIRAKNIVHDESNRTIDMKAQDIVKIFTSDNEFIEVTHEQAERVKQSTCALMTSCDARQY